MNKSTILISIKPEYASKILDGIKKYEYRTTKAKNVNKMIIYATSPVKKVIGEAEVKNILEDTPNNIWNKTKELSGTKKESFDNYFKNRKKAIAYEIGKTTRYDKPKELSELGIDFVPQSYIYYK